MMKLLLCALVAVNALHYENPASGCGADEKAVNPADSASAGDLGICAPECTGAIIKDKCPNDAPTGVTARAGCNFHAKKDKKRCILICNPASNSNECGEAKCVAESALGGVCVYEKPATPTPAPVPTPPPAPTPKGNGTNWVVIVAGSKTFPNYRHQADACHAYQIVKKGGVPPEQIILMMEDDVANSRENPFPGKLFNKPTAKGTPGVDVYAGCNIDYKGSVVTAKLFLDVLQGNAEAVNGMGSGKVLKSGPNDKVFINFADHGGAQIVEMPNGPYLQAKALNAAIKNMHTKNMYQKLVFYMEACNGGSMFAGLLPTDINVFATTAANPTEPSWGTYCPPQDKVDGKVVGACLGDLYSVNWMEDSDQQSGLDQTLEEQYEQVVKLTNKSHPIEYGTQTFATTDHAKDYMAPMAAAVPSSISEEQRATDKSIKLASTVDTRDVELVQTFYKYLRATSEERISGGLAAELTALVKGREDADAKFRSIFNGISQLSAKAPLGVASPAAMDCVQQITTSTELKCGKFSSYSMKYQHQLASFCTTHATEAIEAAVARACAM